MLCFSLVHPVTLNNIESIWVKEVQENCPGKPYLLVGLESELRDDFDSRADELRAKGLSPVSIEEGQRMAYKIHSCCYIECSISKFTNIDEVFENAIKYALDPPPITIYRPVESEGGCCEVF